MLSIYYVLIKTDSHSGHKFFPLTFRTNFTENKHVRLNNLHVDKNC